MVVTGNTSRDRNEFSAHWIGSQHVCDDIVNEKCKKSTKFGT
jgi:hypothetical protein